MNKKSHKFVYAVIFSILYSILFLFIRLNNPNIVLHSFQPIDSVLQQMTKYYFYYIGPMIIFASVILLIVRFVTRSIRVGIIVSVVSCFLLTYFYLDQLALIYEFIVIMDFLQTTSSVLFGAVILVAFQIKEDFPTKGKYLLTNRNSLATIFAQITSIVLIYAFIYFSIIHEFQSTDEREVLLEIISHVIIMGIIPIVLFLLSQLLIRNLKISLILLLIFVGAFIYVDFQILQQTDYQVYKQTLITGGLIMSGSIILLIHQFFLPKSTKVKFEKNITIE